jgi:hypothetical protein
VYTLGLRLGNLLTGSSSLVLQKEHIWELLWIKSGNQAVYASPTPTYIRTSVPVPYVYFKKSSTTSAYPGAGHLISVRFLILELPVVLVLKYRM